MCLLRRSMRLSFTFFVSILVIYQPTTLCDAEQSKLVKFGVIAPITGGNASNGQDISRTVKLLEKRLNKSSRKYQYRFTIEDGRCGVGNGAATAAYKFINIDQVKFLITGCSGETLKVGPIAERNKVVTIAVLSMHKDVKHLGDYIFRTYLDAEKGMKKIADLIVKEGAEKVAVISEDVPFTVGNHELVSKFLGERVVFSDFFEADNTDLRTLILKARSYMPDAYYFGPASPDTAIALVNQARQLGVTQPIYSFQMPDYPKFLEATGKNSNGIRYLVPPRIGSESPDFASFMEEFVKDYGEKPSLEFVVRTTYDAVNALVDGIESVGVNPTAVKDFLYHYRKKGALGVVEFDKNGDIKNLNFMVKYIKGGRTYWLQ
ncbi:MAG: ABC transporter substrate-binding protein [Candidatus Dadabacteria bacterium]|nr:MAG: ABC transporter substrate-binding protein [Candidatus Dadabacteria bacterium]